MIYMSSTSANNGAYNLTVTFDLGSDADIDTVNVTNRVQSALAQLPPEVSLEGVTTLKRSSSVLQFMMFYSENEKQTPLFISNYVTINVLDQISRTPESARPRCLRSSTIRCGSGSTSSASSA